MADSSAAERPSLSISAEKILWIAGKARRFEAKDIVTEPDPGSNASDDGAASVLEDHPDDPVMAELMAIIRGLNEDEQIDLVALVWLGRGDGDLTDWSAIRGEAARAHNERTAEYLLGLPLLADYLIDALVQVGGSPDDADPEL